MRKKITTLVLCTILSIPLMAQLKTDAFFNYQVVERAIDYTPVNVYYDTEVGFNNMNINATPLDGEIFILTLVSFVYCLKRRKELAK